MISVIFKQNKYNLERVEEVGDVGGAGADLVVDAEARGGDHEGGQRQEEQG